MQASIGFVHTVFFWFKDGVNEAREAAFVEGLKSLQPVETIKEFRYGKAAGTPRSVVDNSYDYSLILHFANKEDHDAYQVDPIHDAFVEAHKDLWARVQVYDVQPLP